MLPLPSPTHPKNQTPVVYTEELTHLEGANPTAPPIQGLDGNFYVCPTF